MANLFVSVIGFFDGAATGYVDVEYKAYQDDTKICGSSVASIPVGSTASEFNEALIDHAINMFDALEVTIGPTDIKVLFSPATIM